MSKKVGKCYNYVVKSREEWAKYKWRSQSSRCNIRLTNGQNDSFPNCTPLSHTHTHLQLRLQRCAVSIPRPCQYQRSHLHPFDHKWACSPLNKNTLPSRATSRGISVINSLWVGSPMWVIGKRLVLISRTIENRTVWNQSQIMMSCCSDFVQHSSLV